MVKILKSKAIAYGIILSVAITGALVLLLSLPDVAIEYMKKGLQLCANSVIPSLFPFMIISELLVESGIGKGITKIVSPLTRRLFGVGNGGSCAFFLGTICGFPIGARAAASMYDKGDMTKCELERTLTFCNNPSPAFVISTVGASIIGNRTVGVVIYLSVILSAMTVGILANAFMRKDPMTTAPRNKYEFARRVDIANVFTSAIRSSALSMLSVCAYVTFFITVVGCFGRLPSAAGMSKIAVTLLFGFFELSSGAASASELGGVFLPAVACAVACGWSGMSVHFQIMSAVGGRGISMKPYILAKAAQAILCGAIAALALKFINWGLWVR